MKAFLASLCVVGCLVSVAFAEEANGRSNRKQFVDSIEGWQVVARRDGKEAIKITSTSGFEKLLTKAKPATAKN